MIAHRSIQRIVQEAVKEPEKKLTNSIGLDAWFPEELQASANQLTQPSISATAARPGSAAQRNNQLLMRGLRQGSATRTRAYGASHSPAAGGPSPVSGHTAATA